MSRLREKVLLISKVEICSVEPSPENGKSGTIVFGGRRLNAFQEMPWNFGWKAMSFKKKGKTLSWKAKDGLLVTETRPLLLTGTKSISILSEAGILRCS